MTRYARFAGVLFAGVFAGFLIAVLVLELSSRGFNGSVYTQVRLVELASLDKLAVATLAPALIATAALTYLTFRTATRWPTVTALALLLVVVALTLIVNLPINADQLNWNPQSPPADWAEVRDRWQLAHAVRTMAATLAFALLALPALPALPAPKPSRREADSASSALTPPPSQHEADSAPSAPTAPPSQREADSAAPAPPPSRREAGSADVAAPHSRRA